MACWLAKTEPGTYAWQDLVDDGETYWDGVRNYQARNNLRSMAVGDKVLIYHSVKEKRVMGLAEVTRASYRDPTADDGDDRWVVVDIVPVKAMVRPVTLAEIKARQELSQMVLVRNSRLSVQPVTEEEFNHVLGMGETGS